MGPTLYIKQNNNRYNYRRRIPTELVDVIQRKELRISLGANFKIAHKRAVELTNTIDECLDLVCNLGLDDSQEIVLKKLDGVGLLYVDKSLLTTIKPAVSTKLTDIIDKYLESLTCTDTEIRDRSLFLRDTLPHLGLPTDIKEIKYSHLKQLQKRIQTLPKRNIQKFRDMPIDKLLEAPVKLYECISITTQNKYIKWLKALFVFAINEGLIEFNPTLQLKTIINTVSAKEQRLPLTISEYNLVSAELNRQMKLLTDVLLLSGMRLSEVYKCKIHSVDGVLCFDLRRSKHKLKTITSYRLIPVHSNLLDRIHTLDVELAKKQYVSKQFKKYIKELNLQDPEKKSLYSLRHSFSTELINNRIDSNIVSELMGHSVQSMTLSRYSKGYDVSILQEAIESLQLTQEA